MENSPFRGRRVGPAPGRPRPRLSASRAAVLQALSDQAEPVTMAALVTLTHLHENTLRGHLDGLVRAGLVRRHRADPAGRGRPAWLYERTETQPSEAIEYAGLAAALARTIVGLSDDPIADAAHSGVDWGRRLARDRGAIDLPAPEAREQLVDLMDDLGFAPRQHEENPSHVRLTRCPLLEAAYRHKEVVCAVHLGLARGALLEYGVDPTGTELVPFSEPGACRLVMPPTGPSAATLPSDTADATRRPGA